MECAHLETLTWLSQADLNELVKRSSKTKNVLKCRGEALVSSLDFYRVGLLVCRRKVLGGSLGGVDDIVAMYFPLSNVQLSFLLPCSLQRHRVGLAVRLLRRAELRPLREGVRAATLRGHEQEARRLHGHQGDCSLLVRTSNPACLQAEVQIVNAFISSHSYACDDFIVNDTPDSKLDSIRSKLLSLAASSSSDGDVGASSAEKGKQRPVRRSSTG